MIAARTTTHSAAAPPWQPPAPTLRQLRAEALLRQLRDRAPFHTYPLRLDAEGFKLGRWWGFSRAELQRLVDDLAGRGLVKLSVVHGHVVVRPAEEVDA